MDEVSELRQQVEELRALVALNSTTEQKPSLWQKFKFKLSEQGSQRGIMAIVPLIATQFHLPTEDLIAICTFVLGLIGTHDIITEG